MSDALKTLCALLLTASLLSSATAQDEPAADDGTEAIRRYAVELIVFSYTEDFGHGSEKFYPDASLADAAGDAATASIRFVDEVEVAPARQSLSLSVYAAHKDALRFVPLTENEYTMAEFIDRFELLDAYDTMMHVGWTQPALPPEYTRPVSLRTFGAVPAGLDGRFELYLSRYLHLVVDLALAAPAEDGPAGAAAAAPSFGEVRPEYGVTGPRLGAPVLYRIREDRIFKNGDIRYFDHPKFGVIAKVTRVEEENGETAESGPLPGYPPE